MKKKVLSIMLTLVLVLSLLPVSALAAGTGRVTISETDLSSDAHLNVAASTLDGVALVPDGPQDTGVDRAHSIALKVTIPLEHANMAVFAPVTDNATFAAYTDDETGNNNTYYEPMPYYRFYSYGYNTLWLAILSEDKENIVYYKITVTLFSGDATLSALTYSVNGGLPAEVPSFAPRTDIYNVALLGSTSPTASISLTPTTSVPGATVTANTGVTLSGGSGTATITVLAKDGVTAKTYTVNFKVSTEQAAARVDDANIVGNVGSGLGVYVMIRLTNETFKFIQEMDDLTSWFSNLPSGLSAAPVQTYTAGRTWIQLGIGGTPVSTGTTQLAITIPAAKLTGGKDLTVTGNIIVTISSQLSGDATLSASSTVKGAAAILGEPSPDINSLDNSSVTLTTAQAEDTTNSGSYVTAFTANDPAATVRVVKYSGTAEIPSYETYDTLPEYNGTDPVSDSDFFVVKVTAANGQYLFYMISVTVLSPVTLDQDVIYYYDSNRVIKNVKMYFLAMFDVPAGYTFIGEGFVASKTDPGSGLVYGSGSSNIKSTFTDKQLPKLYGLISTCLGQDWYVRSYVILEKNGYQYICYSDTVHGYIS